MASNENPADIPGWRREGAPHLFELLDEAAVLQVSLEGLDGGGAVRKAPDGREALHGEVEGVTVLIAGSGEGTTGSRHRYTRTQIHTHTHTHTHILTHTHTHTHSVTDTETDMRNFSFSNMLK